MILIFFTRVLRLRFFLFLFSFFLVLLIVLHHRYDSFVEFVLKHSKWLILLFILTALFNIFFSWFLSFSLVSLLHKVVQRWLLFKEIFDLRRWLILLVIDNNGVQLPFRLELFDLLYNFIFFNMTDLIVCDYAIQSIWDNLAFIGENLKNEIINRVFSIKVVNVHTVLLTDSVGSIFSLVHDRRCPSHFSENNCGGSCQGETLGASLNTQDGNADAIVSLEHLDSFMSLVDINRTINFDKSYFLCLDKGLNAVHDRLVMRKDQKLALVV